VTIANKLYIFNKNDQNFDDINDATK